ncbi:hypothetical protein GS942_23425 [Rhodococcus hoagii]|nr:hypothetical protein [Prescottella equi]NKZ71135.1 hypothetical protein [Prescottella equi]
MSAVSILAAPEVPSAQQAEVPAPAITGSPSASETPLSPLVIVQNLPADGGWNAQAWATIIAACIALTAAGIALFGVFYTQRVNRAATKAQLRQQRAMMIRQERQHQLQIAEQIRQQSADHAMATAAQRRTDALHALVNAGASLVELSDLAANIRPSLVAGNLSVDRMSELKAKLSASRLAHTRLRLLGLAGPLEAVTAALSATISMSMCDDSEADVRRKDMYEKVEKAQFALTTESMKYF